MCLVWSCGTIRTRAKDSTVDRSRRADFRRCTRLSKEIDLRVCDPDYQAQYVRGCSLGYVVKPKRSWLSAAEIKGRLAGSVGGHRGPSRGDSISTKSIWKRRRSGWS